MALTRGKKKKDEVGYVDQASSPTEECAGCKWFRPYKGRRDRNGCAKVMGDINEKGWCKLYAPAAGGPTRPSKEPAKDEPSE